MANVRDADEIIVGTRGFGRIRGALGSVAHALLHDARPVLLDLGGPGLDVAPWAHRVRLVHAEPVDGPAAVTVPPGARSAPTGPDPIPFG